MPQTLFDVYWSFIHDKYIELDAFALESQSCSTFDHVEAGLSSLWPLHPIVEVSVPGPPGPGVAIGVLANQVNRPGIPCSWLASSGDPVSSFDVPHGQFSTHQHDPTGLECSFGGPSSSSAVGVSFFDVPALSIVALGDGAAHDLGVRGLALEDGPLSVCKNPRLIHPGSAVSSFEVSGIVEPEMISSKGPIDIVDVEGACISSNVGCANGLDAGSLCPCAFVVLMVPLMIAAVRAFVPMVLLMIAIALFVLMVLLMNAAACAFVLQVLLMSAIALLVMMVLLMIAAARAFVPMVLMLIAALVVLVVLLMIASARSFVPQVLMLTARALLVLMVLLMIATARVLVPMVLMLFAAALVVPQVLLQFAAARAFVSLVLMLTAIVLPVSMVLLVVVAARAMVPMLLVLLAAALVVPLVL